MVALDKFVKEGKKFDFVFGDLTDIPISETPTGEIWNFIRTILQQSFKILKPTGKYLTHVMKRLPKYCSSTLKLLFIFNRRVTAPIAQSRYACTKNNWNSFNQKLSSPRPKHLCHLSWKNGYFIKWVSMFDRPTVQTNYMAVQPNIYYFQVTQVIL